MTDLQQRDRGKGDGLQEERAPGLRQVIDVEALLIWAVQKEYAHRYAGSAGLFEGEAAVAAGEGAEPFHAPSGDGVWQMQKIAGLGCRPDEFGGNSHCHPDAEAVILAGIEVLGGALLYSLLVPHARSGLRPDWRPDLRELEAGPRLVWDDRSHEYRPCVMTAGRAKAEYCAVQYRDRTAEMEAARGYYVAWWDALNLLAEALAGRLAKYEATPPAVPRRPWAVEKKSHNPVVDGGGD